MKNVFLYKQRRWPRKLLVDIHTYCNARCRMCPYPKYSKKQDQGVMAWDLYTQIVDEFAAMGQEGGFTPVMSYCSMAEPFLADDLERYTAYAAKQGVSVYLNTNGGAMTKEKVDKLIESGFDGKIHVSFHGITKEIYEKIMGLAYEPSLEQVAYLISVYDKHKICIRGVDDGWPAGEKEKWLAYWQGQGVEIEYLPPISRCGSVTRLLGEKLKKDKVPLYGCTEHHPLVEMVILYDGRVVMCCQDMGREVILGNVKDQGLTGVWHGPVRQAMVLKLYSGGAFGKGFLCARCEQAITSRWELTQAIWKAAIRKRRH